MQFLREQFELLKRQMLGVQEEDWEPVPYEPPKFEVGDPAALQYLDEFGYVVFKNVATEEEVIQARNLFWDFAEDVKGFEGTQALSRNDPSTWDSVFWMGDPYTGIVFRYGIGQSPFLWYCRSLPKVKKAFVGIWNDDDLLTSYDGCGVFRPPEFNPKWQTKGGWFHIDQNVYRKPGRHAVQGLLNLYPSGDYDGGFVVVPRSTHMIEKAFKENDNICSKEHSRDFVRMTPEYSWWKNARAAAKNNYDYRPVKLCLAVGELALWDSRVIHCNCPATKMSDDPQAARTLKRLAAYICMTPTKSAKNLDELIAQRVFAFQKGISTTHWPHDFQPNSSSFFAKEFKVGAEHVKLTKEQAKLITGNQSEVDVYQPIDQSTVVLPF